MIDRAARHYPNPYDFVPLEDAPTLYPRPDQAHYTGLSGQIAFTIEALSPLCVNQDPGQPNRRGVYEFAHLDGRPTLPATSIKGMLRSVHEVVTNSTMGLLKNEWYRSRVPPPYLPGERRTIDRLSATESVFGMVGGKGEDSVGYAGRLLISDVQIPQNLLETIEIWRPARGGMPKPRHESFYFAPDRTILGRKFYYHQNYRRVREIYAEERRRASEPRTIQVVREGGRLGGGKLRFFNLSEEELAALVYTLVLEDELAHKLGYGKPLGLGSLRIQIKHLLVEQHDGDVPARLLSYDDAPQLRDRTAEVNALRQRAKRDWLARPQGAHSYAAFAAIARWQTAQIYIYPDYGFFLDERRRPSKKTLWQYQGRNKLQLHPAAAVPAVPPAGPPQHEQVVESPEPQPRPDEPRQSIDLRPIGVARMDDRGNAYVEGIDGKRYWLREESAPREVLRSILDCLRAGETPRVRYRGAKQRIEGKNMNVAHDVESVEEDA
jgi:CRISPR/Cas system CSM-associated protein Csm3 (group 7 of RAMP superfamily)